MTKKVAKDKILNAIEGSGGIINIIANRLGVSWSTAKNYIENDEELKRAWLDEKEKMIDNCENTIYTAVDKGDIQAAKWVLSTLGKGRGWGENNMVTLNTNSIRVEFVDVGKNEDENTSSI
ncbi:MAG: hypothetical protein NC925_01750 [Candidatus Omnitrophica bacterium]|nr:hypothetical protein [Candidatus Omnitrophota bacterium]